MTPMKFDCQQITNSIVNDPLLNTSDNWFNRHRFRIVKNFLPPLSKQIQLLDYGCGNGSFLTYLQRQEGCSFALSGYEPYYTTCVVDGAQIHRTYKEIKHNSFDFVTALDVIEHIEDDKTALKQIHRLLNLRGRLLIIVPAYQWCYSKFDEAIGHYRRYDKKSIYNVLEKSGFSIDHFTYFFSYLVPAGILRKYYLSMRKRFTKRIGFPADPLGLFSLPANLEFKLLKITNFYLPFGYAIFVACSKK